MLGSVRSETYCFAKLQYFPCFTKFSDVFLLLVRKIMSGEVWKYHNPAACRLQYSCQDSISRSPKRGVYDTILTLKNRRENRRVLLPTVLRRFFVVFVNVVYVVDIQYDTQIYVLPLCLYVVKNRADCLQNSLFWLVIKSILRSHLDYFAVLHWLFETSKHSKQHARGYWTPPRGVFFQPGNKVFVSWRMCRKVSAAVSVWYYYCNAGG